MGELTGRLESVWATIDGLTTHARISSGYASSNLMPIVLVHGLSVSSRYMVPTGVRLAPYYRVYAPDLPGFGKSAHPPNLLNIPALADVLVRWMDVFNVGSAVMIGNSMGCQIIADIALRHPERLSRAVLIGPTMDRLGRTALEQARRLLLDALREPITSILTQARDYWACGLRRTIGTLRHALEDRIEEKLPYISVPTLVVRGAKDPIAPQRWAEEVTRLLPNGQLVVLPGAPHAVNYDAPAELVQAVRQFLEDSQPAIAIPSQTAKCLESKLE